MMTQLQSEHSSDVSAKAAYAVRMDCMHSLCCNEIETEYGYSFHTTLYMLWIVVRPEWAWITSTKVCSMDIGPN